MRQVNDRALGFVGVPWWRRDHGAGRNQQDVEKALSRAFSTTEAENAVSRFPHFQRLTAIENGGTSLCRTQAAEKLRFSTPC